MSSNTITIIFFLGGLTFLVNWAFLLQIYFKYNSIKLENKIHFTKSLLIFLLISTFGVLAMGVLFVSALMFSHG
jgi:hypothetical protein